MKVEYQGYFLADSILTEMGKMVYVKNYINIKDLDSYDFKNTLKPAWRKQQKNQCKEQFSMVGKRGMLKILWYRHK